VGEELGDDLKGPGVALEPISDACVQQEHRRAGTSSGVSEPCGSRIGVHADMMPDNRGASSGGFVRWRGHDRSLDRRRRCSLQEPTISLIGMTGEPGLRQNRRVADADSRIPVDDPADPRIAEFIGLRDAQLRRRREAAGGDLAAIFIAEGDIVIERAVRAGYRLRSLLVDATRTSPLPSAAAAVPVFAAGPALVLTITGMAMHRGCLASFDRRPVPTPGEVLADATRVVVLENLNNPTNLGVIARSAVGLGADALILDPSCCDPLYRRASRVAMGEVFGLPYAYTQRFPGGLDVVTDAGFSLIALTPEVGAEPIDDVVLAPEEKVALVLGSEGPGLTADTLNRVHRQVRIPIHGGVDSLNVAAAAAIACYVLGRGRPVP